MFTHELASTGLVRFYVRVRPGAPRTVVVAVMDDDSVKIAVAAPPEGGKANAELLRYLSREFGVPLSNVRIVSGKTQRVKLIEVRSEK